MSSYAAVWFFGDKKKKIHAIPLHEVLHIDIAKVDYKKPYCVVHKGERKAAQIMFLADKKNEIVKYNNPEVVGEKRFAFSSMRRSTAMTKLDDEEKERKSEKAKAKRAHKKKLKDHDKEVDKQILDKHKKSKKVSDKFQEELNVMGEDLVVEQTKADSNTLEESDSACELIKSKVKSKESSAPLAPKEFSQRENVLLSHGLVFNNNIQKSSTQIKTHAVINHEPSKPCTNHKIMGTKVVKHNEIDPMNYDAIEEFHAENVDYSKSGQNKKSGYIIDLEQQIKSFDVFKNDMQHQVGVMHDELKKLTNENAILRAELKVKNTLEQELTYSAPGSNNSKVLRTVKKEPIIKKEISSALDQPKAFLTEPEAVIDLTESPSPKKPATPVNNNYSPATCTDIQSNPDSEDFLAQQTNYPKSTLQSSFNSNIGLIPVNFSTIVPSDNGESPIDSRKDTASIINSSSESSSSDREMDTNVEATEPESVDVVERTGIHAKDSKVDPMTPQSALSKKSMPSSRGSAHASFIVTPVSQKNSGRKTTSAKRKLTYTPVEKVTKRKNRNLPLKQAVPKRKHKKSSSKSTIREMRNIEEKHFKKAIPVKHAETKLVVEGLFPSKGKVCKAEDSEHEYDSDNFEKFDDAADFSAFRAEEEKTGKQLKLFHLKHGCYIPYLTWKELLQSPTPSIFIRQLAVLLWKKKKRLMDCAVQVKKAGVRIPGRERKRMPVLLKTVLWKSYFYYLRCTFLDHLVERYEKKWKTYLSRYINQLIQENRAKMERKKKAAEPEIEMNE